MNSKQKKSGLTVECVPNWFYFPMPQIGTENEFHFEFGTLKIEIAAVGLMASCGLGNVGITTYNIKLIQLIRIIFYSFYYILFIIVETKLWLIKLCLGNLFETFLLKKYC